MNDFAPEPVREKLLQVARTVIRGGNSPVHAAGSFFQENAAILGEEHGLTKPQALHVIAWAEREALSSLST